MLVWIALLFPYAAIAQITGCPANTVGGSNGMTAETLTALRLQKINDMNNLSIDVFTSWDEYFEAGKEVFTDDGTLFLPVTGVWGGPYPGTGVEGALEYMALANRWLNHGMIDISSVVTPTIPGTNPPIPIFRTPNENTIVLSFTANMDLFQNHEETAIQGTPIFAINDFPMGGTWETIFEPCGSKIRRANLVSDDLSMVFQAGLPSNGWICEKIHRWCNNNDPSSDNTQFRDAVECLRFYNSIPVESCGPPGIMLGNSRLCHWLHLFLIPINPDMHCKHVGPRSGEAPNAFCYQDTCDSAIPCVEGCAGGSSGGGGGTHNTNVNWNLNFNKYYNGQTPCDGEQ